MMDYSEFELFEKKGMFCIMQDYEIYTDVNKVFALFYSLLWCHCGSLITTFNGCFSHFIFETTYLNFYIQVKINK